MEWYSIEEIAKLRKVSKQAVYKQVNGKSMSEQLVGHTMHSDGKLFIDEEGFALLQKSREGSPVVYVEAPEKQELEELKKKYAELQAKYEAKDAAMTKMTDTLADIIKQNNENLQLAMESKLYIEQKENAEQKLKEVTAENDSLKTELEQIKNRSLWQRIRNK